MSSERSEQSETHYKTLGLSQGCTSQEIKDAFVSLSKVHHPDLHSNDAIQKEKFVKIYEAYAVLSRPERRVVYDSDLHLKEQGRWQEVRVETNAPRYTTWRDESIWSMRDKTKENFSTDKPYYGIKGVNRVSNYWIAGGAVVLMLLGTMFHYVALRHSATFTVSKLNAKDEKYARELFAVRQTAIRNGNERQIELLTGKFGWKEDKSTTGKD